MTKRRAHFWARPSKADMDFLALFLMFLARNFGTLREKKIERPCGHGIKRLYVLGPLTVVPDIIILKNGTLIHYINDRHCYRVTPGWDYDKIKKK